MALSRVQAIGKVNADSVTAITLTFATPPALGNGIIVPVHGQRTGGLSFPAGGCVDNHGNTYQLAVTQQVVAGTSAVAIYYCPLVAATGTPFTITVTATATGGRFYVGTAIEVGGVEGGLAVDQTVSSASASLHPTTGTTAPLTLADAFLVAAHVVTNNQSAITVATVSPPWVQEYEELNFTAHMPGEADTRLLTGAAGAMQECHWDNGANGNWAAALAAFGASAPVVVPGLVVTIHGEPWTFREGSLAINATLNGIDTLNGLIDIWAGGANAGREPPTLRQEIIVTEDGVRIFGGRIDALEYRAITADASQDLTVQLDAKDFNVLADDRTVSSFASPGGETLKQVLTRLVAELAPSGVTLSPAQPDGPVLEAFRFELQTVNAILDTLTDLTEFVHEIDYGKVLRMWQPGTVAAPFDLVDGDRHAVGDIVITPVASDYANRIIVRASIVGSYAPQENTFAWHTDGVNNLFPMFTHVLNYSWLLVDTPLETVPGEGFESIGAPGSGALWEFHETAPGVPPPAANPAFPGVWPPPFTQWLSRAAGAPPPGATWPAGPYPIQLRVLMDLPILCVADDLAEQATNGIVEKQIDVGDEGGSWWTVQEIANSLLARHKAHRQIVRYATFETGARVGQSQTMAIARRGLSGPYFITDVETRMLPGMHRLIRTITAQETELYQGSWRDTYKLWAQTAGGGGGGTTTTGGPAPPAGTPYPHHASHEPGGMDPMTVDSTASIGSLRTLGTGANQAAAGNDPRFSTPALHAPTHGTGGTDPVTLAVGQLSPVTGPSVVGRGTSTGAAEVLPLGPGLVVDGGTLTCTARASGVFDYIFNTGTAAPPANARVIFNAGYPYTGVTRVFADFDSARGEDLYWGWMRITVGSFLMVQDKDVHTQYAEFTVTGAPIDQGTYVELPVVWKANGGSALAVQDVLVRVTTVSHTGATRVGAIGIVLDGGGAVLTTGVKGFLSVPFACTITGWTLLSTDASATAGSIVIDVWKDTYANYPPAVADTITASAKPTLSSANKNSSTTLTGWTTAIAAGDVLGFTVDSVTTVTRVTLSLTVQAM